MKLQLQHPGISLTKRMHKICKIYCLPSGNIAPVLEAYAHISSLSGVG